MSALPTAGGLKWRDRPIPQDMESIRQLVTRTGVFNAEEIDVAVELVQDRIKRSLSSDYHFVFADKDKELQAYSCFGRIPFTDGRFDLYWIAAEPAAQGAGLASRLLSITEAGIRELGGKKLYAETSSRKIYAAAHHFYHKTGFMLESTFHDFYRDGDDKLVFVKSLL